MKKVENFGKSQKFGKKSKNLKKSIFKPNFSTKPKYCILYTVWTLTEQGISCDTNNLFLL